MPEIKAEILGAQELLVKLTNADAVMRANIRRKLAGLQYTLQRHIKAHFKGNPLHNRSSKLVDSINVAAIEEDSQKISGPVGTNTIYGAIQEHGGTSRAKNVQNLTIPLDEVLTAAGVARYTARQIIGNPGIGGFTSTFFRKGILFGSTGGKGGGIVPLFALKPEVTLPARPYMAPGLAETQPEAEQQLQAAVDAALAGRRL